jgi:uncharacterized phage protein (TIGR01671 family)
MREIKFRLPMFGRDGKFLRWHHWGLIQCPWGVGFTGVFNPDIACELSQQYTGLRDKNNTDIYEGDVVRGTYTKEYGHGTETTGHIYQVIYLNGSFDINNPSCCAICKDGNSCHSSLYEFLVSCDSVEVIGNVIENPELLEARDDNL